jgi:hypothetical protein
LDSAESQLCSLAAQIETATRQEIQPMSLH